MSNRVLLQAKNLALSFGARDIFSQVTLMIHEGDKASLVGANGAGKTSLFRLLTGQEEPTEGVISWTQGVRVGYLQQLRDVTAGETVFSTALQELAHVLALREAIEALERLMTSPAVHDDAAKLELIMEEYAEKVHQHEESGGYGAEARVRSVLKGLGFSDDDLQLPSDVLSGGQKTRLAMARLLLRPYDLLLLDEPTNHLDLQAVEWLEDYLQGYKGAVLVISHDRYFLDKVTRRTLHLEHGTLQAYSGNYSRFLQLREEELWAKKRAYAKDQTEIAKIEEYIRRNKAGVNAKQARGRESQLARRERVGRPMEGLRLKDLKFIPQTPSAEQVIVTHDLAAAYPGKPLFSGLNMTIRRGECVAVLGKNGTGKTSLFKVLLGELAPQAGDVVLGIRVKPAYYAQEQEHLIGSQTILETIRNMRPMTEEQARTLLGRFMFRGDDVFKQVGVLSGGEKSRLVLAQLFLTGANLLLLDEPTNNLDIEAKEALEEALEEFPGTLLVISHDRFFLDRLADRVLELEKGTFTEYLGNYSDYRDRKAEAQAVAQEAAAAQARKEAAKAAAEAASQPGGAEGGDSADDGAVGSGAKPAGGAKKKPTNPWKREQAIAAAEATIARLEERLQQLTEALADEETYRDGERARSCQEEFAQVQDELALVYEEWEALLED
ncbi:ABC-F family ATP-binding cassette domain-containing protein [Heliophilum fasciatum]|uniref:ATP-binding cassette subfamily F protein 3 n=1 Tax=Heliophilum fasciatum TaxID=35700 RepID=A0A4R2RZD0_9FIRM|nr:ABC-F family ATP-binding cassette domain-containing protein [Heliophilum fasciatum]MCW2276725.1 ATP-binding cassette subfamily F protein 3 [Heliophilum fasciatum]TCP68894.1 ATP-binding cassette subfamily F protein 3 [Heliophilum fasciatum]